MFGKLLIGIAVGAAIAGTAGAQTISIGGSGPASACYRAAASDGPQPRAVRICTGALEQDNLTVRDQVATFVNRGVVHFMLRDYAAALRDYDAALALDRGQPEATMNRGIAMLMAGQNIQDAISFIDRGLARRAQSPWIGYYSRGMANEMLRRDAAAYRDYRRAQELRPDWELPRQALSRFTVRRS